MATLVKVGQKHGAVSSLLSSERSHSSTIKLHCLSLRSFGSVNGYRGSIGVPQLRQRSGLASRRGARSALPGLDAQSVDTVVSALKGPTLSELVVYGQSGLSMAGSAWASLTSPLAIFGTDRWSLNLLFYAVLGLLGYSLILQTPKQ